MKFTIWIVLIALGVMTSAALAATVRVITEDAVIRKERRFFAPAVARVRYGAALEELSRQGDWLRVNYQGKRGWIHVSAVQEPKIDLGTLAGGQAQQTSQDEIALAGKGFTPEVEKAFQEKNPNLRYDAVNQVSLHKVSEQKLESFFRAGNLKEPGGGS